MSEAMTRLSAGGGESGRTGFEAYDARPWLKFYPEGRSGELGPIPYRNFGEIITRASQTYATQPAFTVCLPTGTTGTLTYAEVDRLSDQFAAYLRFELGLAKGDRVAIQSPNCLAYPIFLYGAAKAGCVIVNINPLYTVPEIEHTLLDSGAKLVAIIDMFADKLGPILPKSQVQTVLLISVADFMPPCSTNSGSATIRRAICRSRSAAARRCRMRWRSAGKRWWATRSTRPTA